MGLYAPLTLSTMKKVRFIKNPVSAGYAYTVNETAVLSDKDAQDAINKKVAIEVSTEKGDKEVEVKKAPTKLGKKEVQKR